MTTNLPSVNHDGIYYYCEDGGCENIFQYESLYDILHDYAGWQNENDNEFSMQIQRVQALPTLTVKVKVVGNCDIEYAIENAEPVHLNAEMYFAFDPQGSMDTYKTLSEAKDSAQESVDWYRDNIDDCWDDSVEQVCYGVILGKVVQTESRIPEPDEGEADEIVDYDLKHFREPTLSAADDRMAKNSARYLWLRDNWGRLTTATYYHDDQKLIEEIYLNDFGQPIPPESVDAAIDAAQQAAMEVKP